MNIEEIFLAISSHLAKGLKIHNMLANAFGFLNLDGYKKCQEYHLLEELCNYRKLNNFYLDNYDKLIIEKTLEDVDIIPANWYKHLKEEVDANTKRAAIKDLMKKWVDWEKETKVFLEQQYKLLYDMNDLLGAVYILKMIREVSDELKNARKKQIDLDSIGYDISLIIDEQECLYKKYQKRIKNIYEDDD